MKVIYISTVFPSEKDGSTIYTDIAEELVSRGHTVTVVASEEKKKSKGTRLVSERGCDVLWVKTGNMYDVGKIEKGLSLLTLSDKFISAIKKFLSDKEFDLVIYEAPPATLAKSVNFAKKKFNAPSYLMMKDIFPQNAVDIGLMSKGIIYRYFKHKEKLLYKSADVIGCMSQMNCDYIAEHNPEVNKSKLQIFPNCKKISAVPQKNIDFPMRKKYEIPLNKTVFVMGGNMGKPQALPFLCESAKKLANDDNLHFLFVGRGTEWDYVKGETKDLSNVTLLKNLPRDEYEMLITECDVGIVSLDHRFTIPNYPSRILSYMEYAMPVVVATDRNTDFKNLIEDSNCGLWCPSDDVESFIENIRKLASDDSLRKSMGGCGRKYLEDNFQVAKSIDILEDFVANHTKK
jgi:glycosyltransferase involved in cell wall biosynthesis